MMVTVTTTVLTINFRIEMSDRHQRLAWALHRLGLV